MIDKAFLTSLAASLHVAGLRDQELSLASQPSLGEGESRWVEGVVKCATALDSYWSGGEEKLAITLESNFEPPPRFKDSKSIGHGGMGVVYSAFDQTTSETVAIKVAKSLGGNSESIKREFRTLAKIRHPNLVVLKELHQFNGRVFFSMEFIRGERFNSESVNHRTTGKPWLPNELADLCDRLHQLVDGIDFLHRSGFAHCDVKPSNILVTSSGRVVVLDLGLAQSIHRQRRRQTHCLGGTSAYMSPEQASGEPPQPASDWFAFGVVMFETLFGYRPFQGSLVDILFDKLAGNVIAPASQSETGIPESLLKLCNNLLSPAPSRRPKVEEIRWCLKLHANQSSASFKPPVPQTRFFGRKKELESLDRALVDSSNASGPTLLLVEGESGIGKTQLIQKFLKKHRCSPDTIVLSGRCYENERIPYKAIDAVVSELATQWRLLESDFVSVELINSISSVFSGFSKSVCESSFLSEGARVPTTAADGLQAVLAAFLSERKRVVIFIDDIQWADTDSGRLLCKIITGIPLLLICSHRPMEFPNKFFEHLRENFSKAAGSTQNCRQIKVSPFNDHDAEQLLCRDFPGLSKQVLGKAIGASEGVPMFLTSLAHQLCTMPVEQIESNTLDWTRDLEPQAKRLLDLVCASGYPLPQAIALEAADVSHDMEASVSALSARQLVTLTQLDGEVLLSPFHDMIRETTYAKLDAAEKKVVHSAIATVCEIRKDIPPARLAFHFGEAGQQEKCCHYSILSGDVAANSQAFAESVRAYREALDGFVGADEQKRDLKQKLASSLARLGRAGDAGDLYMELTSFQDGKSAHFLQAAAYQYCVAGRIEDSMHGFNRLLQPWGYSTFESETSALWRLVFLRLKLRIPELKNTLGNWLAFYQPRSKGMRGSNNTTAADSVKIDGTANNERVPRQQHDQVEAIRTTQLCDLLWDVGNALSASAFENVQAALFVNYSLQVAIRQNDKVRTLRAKILWAAHEAAIGSRKEKSIRERLNSMDTVTIENNAYLAGTHLKAKGFLAMCNGIWDEAASYFAAADDYLREHCADSHEEIGAVQLWGMVALQYSGQVKSTFSRYQELLASPANRDHRLNISNLMSFFSPFVCLVKDRPSEALSSVDEAMKMWPVDKLYIQHIRAVFGRAEVFLYTGDYRQASDRVEKLWEMYARSSYRHVQLTRVLISELRGRCAVNRFESSEGQTAERVARQTIKNLEREKATWAHPMAQRVQANIELKKQNFEAAKIALLAARDGFERCKMRLDRNTAEAKLCEVSGVLETERFKLVESWFESQEIENPQALIGMHFPGGSEV